MAYSCPSNRLPHRWKFDLALGEFTLSHSYLEFFTRNWVYLTWKPNIIFVKRKQKTGFEKTDLFVDRLNRSTLMTGVDRLIGMNLIFYCMFVVVALQTGLITSITAILELILFVRPHSTHPFLPKVSPHNHYLFI